MLRGLTAKQFKEWITYAKLEPFDEVRADYRAAQIAQMILLVNLAKGAQVPKLNELILKFEEEAPKNTDWRQMKMISQMIAQAYTE